MPESPLDPCPGSCLGEIDFVHLLLAMRMTHQHLPPLWVGIPSTCGGRWPPMRWTGSCGTSLTPGLACNYHLEVVDNHALILAYLSAPGAVSHSVAVA